MNWHNNCTKVIDFIPDVLEQEVVVDNLDDTAATHQLVQRKPD